MFNMQLDSRQNLQDLVVLKEGYDILIVWCDFWFSVYCGGIFREEKQWRGNKIGRKVGYQLDIC